MRRFAFALGTALLVAACTSSTGTTPSDAGTQADTAPTVTCEKDPRVDTYAANLTKTSASGATKVTLVSSDPAPPIRGTNTWVVKLTDGGGAPLANEELAVDLFMPDHGHGSSVKPTITSNGDGTYKLESVYLFMPGVWRITISRNADAAPTDAVQFFFCIAG